MEKKKKKEKRNKATKLMKGPDRFIQDSKYRSRSRNIARKRSKRKEKENQVMLSRKRKSYKKTGKRKAPTTFFPLKCQLT